MEISEGGRFRIGRNIGSGTFGEIYLGFYTILIIKIILNNISNL